MFGYSSLDEERIIRQCLNGDTDAFSVLVERYKIMAYTVAYRILGDADNANDAAQDSFIAAFTSLKHFRFGSKFSTWLYSIVLNKCRDRLRESTTIEQSKADSTINDYTGTDLSLRDGYDFSSRSSFSAGYSYLLRDFKDSPVGVQTSVQAASLDWSMDLTDRWSILAGYDHEWIKVKTDLASGTADNNVFSAAVRYDF